MDARKANLIDKLNKSVEPNIETLPNYALSTKETSKMSENPHKNITADKSAWAYQGNKRQEIIHKMSEVRRLSLSNVNSTFGDVKKTYVENKKLKKIITKLRSNTKANLARIGKTEPEIWMAKHDLIQKRAKNMLSLYKTHDPHPFGRESRSNTRLEKLGPNNALEYVSKSGQNRGIDVEKKNLSRNTSICNTTTNTLLSNNIFTLQKDMISRLQGQPDPETLVIHDKSKNEDFEVSKSDLDTYLLTDNDHFANSLLKCNNNGKQAKTISGVYRNQFDLKSG